MDTSNLPLIAFNCTRRRRRRRSACSESLPISGIHHARSADDPKGRAAGAIHGDFARIAPGRGRKSPESVRDRDLADDTMLR